MGPTLESSLSLGLNLDHTAASNETPPQKEEEAEGPQK